VDFKTRINWQETHKLLKVEFPVQVTVEEAIEEIQFGYVKRPTHKSRRFDADRFEVCSHRYKALSEPDRCFAVLNDSKYGVSTSDNRIQLSLLRAPLIPDMFADKGIQEFTYSFYTDHCSFNQSDVIRQGYELNYPAACGNLRIGEKSFFQVSNRNIILETLKFAEDGSRDIILRLYEAGKQHTDLLCW
jgi:alpha-mannosidase